MGPGSHPRRGKLSKREEEMNLSEAANRVIDLGRKVREYYDTELPKRYPNYPVADHEEESVPPPPEEKELRDFLSSLSDELLYQLILLMYLGRGDVGTEDLEGYYQSLKDTVGNREQTASRMMLFKVILADELSDGLEELRKHNINVDKMPLKRVKARKR
jgi:hypothetical protein